MAYYLGVDFGAQNIMVHYLKDGGGGGLVQLEQAKEYMPNCYARMPDGGELFGAAALEAFYDEGRIDEGCFFEHYKGDLVSDSEPPSTEGEAPQAEADGEITPKWLLERILLEVLRRAVTYLKQNDVRDQKTLEIARIVVTVPAGWQETYLRSVYLDALEHATQELGIATEFLIVSEPAAASAHLLRTLEKQGEQGAVTCVVLDIGASTMDVSLCNYEFGGDEPIQVIKGLSSEKAGRHFDKLMAKYLGDEADPDNLHEAERLKIDGSSRPGGRSLKKFYQMWKSKFDESRLQRHARELVDEAFRLIGQTLDTYGAERSVDFLVACGGMSALGFGFGDALKRRLARELPACRAPGFDGDQFAPNLRRNAIGYGACRLAENPALVTERLGCEVWASLEREGNAPLRTMMIPADVKLAASEVRRSLVDAIRSEHPRAPQNQRRSGTGQNLDRQGGQAAYICAGFEPAIRHAAKGGR